MRLLFACEFYYPSVGGVQEVIRQVAERLVERGHHVTVATTYLPERASRTLNGVEIVEFRVAGNLALGLRGELAEYRKYVLEADYDLLMIKAAQQWTLDALIPVLDAIRQPKVFIPCGFSGLYDPAFAEYFRTMPDTLRKFDHLIFYASKYRDIDFARAHGLSNLSVVPNGANEREFNVQKDHEFRRHYAIPSEAFVVLTVGSLTGQKGHHELAYAFALADFAGREAVLILNGHPPRPNPVRRPSLRDLPMRAVRLCKRIVRSALIAAKLSWVLKVFGYRVDGPPPVRSRSAASTDCGRSVQCSSIFRGRR